MRTRPTPQDHDVLSEDELARIRDIMADAEFSSNLTLWEEEFCDSIRERIAEYGGRARISDRQWEVIDRIEGKV